MASTIQVRRGTAAEWTSANPTLAAGEFGFETDTGKLKLGDGSNDWSALGYFEAIIPTYTITPDFSSVDEGNTLTFNIGGENITDGTYYWTIESNAGDFTTTNGSFSISSNVGSFSVTPTADSTTEGVEVFEVAIRSGSITGTILQTSSSVTINDTSLDPAPIGQVAYTSPGTYSWVAPAGVTSVSAVVVGGGGGGTLPTAYGGIPGGGGAGGGLGWKNNIAVTPGTSYTVVVGNGGAGVRPGQSSATAGGTSSFRGLQATGGQPGVYQSASTSAAGGYSGGDGGAMGGNGGYGGQFSGDNNGYGGGGGGAGGYSGRGGTGQIRNASGRNSGGSSGTGGGGAGGTGSFNPRGGGVGLLGEGPSGIGTTGPIDGSIQFGGPAVGYGGGGLSATQTNRDGFAGGTGGVRIIWGDNRAFPSTNTGDL